MWSCCRARWTRLNKGDNSNAHNTHVDALRLILFLVPSIVRPKSFERKERKPLAGNFGSS